MNKAQKLQASADIVADIANDLLVEAAKPSKASKSVKAVKAVKAAVVEIPEVVVSAKELQVLKVIASSDFADPVSGVVPNYVVALEANIAERSIPGVIASLNKKAMIVASKVKGLGSVVALSLVGKAYAEAAL